MPDQSQERFTSRTSPRCLVVVLLAASAAALLVLAALAPAAEAKPREQAVRDAVIWFGRAQNGDGSWGSGPTRPLVTAEVIAALSLQGAERNGVVVRRGIAWLRQQELAAVDFQARRVRALEAAGVSADVEAEALAGLRNGTAGWGLVGPAGPSAYDTALALDALGVAQQLPPQPELGMLAGSVILRRRADGGWSGDGIPSSAGSSDLATTAEIVRALVDKASPASLAPSLGLLESAITAATPTLELAARLAALHRSGRANVGFQNELLRDGRFLAGLVWDGDPLIVALALRALVTTPGAPAVASAFLIDRDLDGVDDNFDPDADGDGVVNGFDAFHLDAAEIVDTDGNGVGDARDDDDDGDGLPDAFEISVALDSLGVDSDGDRFIDGFGGLVTLARLPAAWDLDRDGFADGEANFGTDPLNPLDHPGKPGDVAPLGRPNGRIGAADALVSLRITRDPSVLPALTGQNRTIAELGADEDEDGSITIGDAMRILGRARAATGAP